MISPSFNIHQFIERVKERDASDWVDLAEQEAVQTWTQSYTLNGSLSDEQTNGMIYENKLLKIIDYIRNGILHKEISELGPELLGAIR
jgi:hypothetical protein